ncbi:MAG TPA: hypothetical protein VFI22_16320, partial [Thermomicrobiales bacterium]|nr:hypothetical protein [Thermomicrobiales bacterium]
MRRPVDPIAAATHPDPYPYYDRLRAGRPFAFDATLDLWVAADFASATAVLTDPRCRVRPPDEPLPPALRGSRAGDIFCRLARMNDGEFHAKARRMVAQALASVDARRVDEISRRWAAALLGERFGRGPDTPISDGAFALPVF